MVRLHGSWCKSALRRLESQRMEHTEDMTTQNRMGLLSHWLRPKVAHARTNMPSWLSIVVERILMHI